MSDRGFDGPSGTIRGGARLRFLAAILAVLGAGVLVPAASGQTPFEMEMDVGGAKLSVTATMPDPMKTAQKFLQCDDAPAGCMDEVFEAATPQLKAKPSTAPPPAPQPEQSSPPPSPAPSEPASAPTQPDSSEASSNTKGSGPPSVRRRSAAPDVGSAGTAEQGELPPLVEERTGPPLPSRSSPPRATEPEPLHGPDPLGPRAPALTLSPPLESGFDWTPLLLGIFLAAGSLGLLFLVLVAAPQHSLARVSHPLADRRYELGLIGAVMLLGVAVGYLVATGLG
jgi:hypothetical protein